WHYQPRFEIQINKIKDNLGALPLEAVIDSKRGVASGATPLGANYLEKGRVKFYRTSEVEEMFLQAEEAVFINDEDDEKLKRSRLVDGDVLLTITGAKFGKSAVVSAKHLPANISQHSVRFKPDPKKVDAHFLVAYLNSKTGQVAIWKEAYGATRPAIDFPSVRSLAVPKVLPLAQKYIGDKVRQAEQLRAWAKRLYRIPAFIDAFIQGALPLSLTDSLFSLMKNSNNDAIKELTKFLALNIEDAQMKQNFQDFIEKNKMGSVDIEREFSHINTVSTLAIEDFLSAQTYRPAITDAFDKITSKKFSTLQSISLEPIRQGATPKFSTIGKKCIKSKQTRDLFLDETGYEVVDPNDEQNKRIVRLKRNDILVTRQGAGTVGRASIFLDDEETYITDSLFLVRIDPAKANPAFVAGFLRSYTGQRLIEKGVYGSTGQLNLSSTALRNIPILDVPLEFQNFLGETLCTADTLFKLSTRLTQSAKTLVEALIEGQLTEKQLIQAQQALEDGNNSLDQTIISKLSAEGYAIEGATPLFSDVDELYSLLENAAQAEAEE
ncbi:TPA: restriction endonuclease subunit S, partial [Klebsiella pneumoniae]